MGCAHADDTHNARVAMLRLCCCLVLSLCCACRSATIDTDIACMCIRCVIRCEKTKEAAPKKEKEKRRGRLPMMQLLQPRAGNGMRMQRWMGMEMDG